ncbi:GNAT family N-acetyltransferase [Lachnospiraceae bacterium 50-23]|jgi:uncharacterized membrane protein YjjP (DUF1212 family)/GNAT superfamily N-acetyltransferase|nr:GNAT family N-acetyltransferase [Dorea sp.]GFI36866.1 putative N-acetyltransferase YvbK [Lachnospiraceae bacterium]
MNIQQVTENKRTYMDILLLADPQEDMIERYLDQSDLFVLSEEGVIKTVCAVQMLKDRRCEIKNIATVEEEQGKGYGRNMIHYVCEHYSDRCDMMYVGTGNSRKTLEFYEKCGFVNSHILAGFFTDNYAEPIYEDGVQLVDMVYLKKKLESEIDVKKVVNLALEAGRILLKNGGEIFRVEETITRICNRFHVDQVDTFMLSHGIFVSVQNKEEEFYTRVKHVPLSGTHLGIVTEVNALSREISAGKVSIDAAMERLREIDRIPPKRAYFQVLGAGTGSGCFGYLLGATIKESMVAFCIGCLLYIWILAAKRHNMSKIIINIAGGVIITALAAAVKHLPVMGYLRMEGMIIGSIMPLVPGMAFVNAIREIADSDFLSGTVRMIDALLVFVYIAIGVGVTLSIYNNLFGGLSI